jgi:hypothetical protein
MIVVDIMSIYDIRLKFGISIGWVLNCRAILIPSTATRPRGRGQRDGLDQDSAG